VLGDALRGRLTEMLTEQTGRWCTCAGLPAWPPARTPHIAYVTRDEDAIRFAGIFDQIVAYAAGAPINVVNPEVLRALAFATARRYD
jgi:hypothetical protein